MSSCLAKLDMAIVGAEATATIQVLRNVGEIEAIREVWEDWCENPDADPELFLFSYNPEREVKRPHVLLISRDGKPDCILVGRLESGVQRMKVGYAAPFRPVVRTLLFPPGSYLGNRSPENSKLLVREISRSLQAGEADCAELQHMPIDSSLLREASLRPAWWRRQHFRSQQAHRRLRLPCSFADFLNQLPRKPRHEARRHARLLHEDFPVDVHITCHRSEPEVERLAADMQKVQAKTYQGALGVGFVDTEDTRGRIQAAAKTGALRGCVMYVSGEPVAFFVGFKFKETLFGQYLSFDPGFGKYSTGLQIIFHAIEESCDPGSGVSLVDLGWGDRRFKRMLCNESWTDSAVYMFAPSWNGLRLSIEKNVTMFLDYSIKHWLTRVGIDRYVRKVFQRAAVRKSHLESDV